MTVTSTSNPTELSAAEAWSRRVRKVGGYIQLAFAAFWLARGGLSITGPTGLTLAIVGVASTALVLRYAIRVTSEVGGRPTGSEAKRIERSINAATVIELVASFTFPIIVVNAGHTDWAMPSIAITIGPLLLWLDHLVHIPRFRPVGWALTVVPFILVAVLSGSTLATVTGLGAGILLLATAAAGFHDLAALRASVEPSASR